MTDRRISTEPGDEVIVRRRERPGSIVTVHTTDPDGVERQSATIYAVAAKVTGRMRPPVVSGGAAKVETKEQRSARRHAIVDPWLVAAGITSPEAWARAAGDNIDKNTPRDWLRGETQKLRKASRTALARALNKTAAQLPG